MDILTNMIAILAVLSLSVERIVEMLKPFPGINNLLMKKKLPEDMEESEKSREEHKRRTWHYVVAISVGFIITFSAYDFLEPTLSEALNADITTTSRKLGICILMGLFASGGSGFWNSSIRLIEEFKNAKGELATAIKTGKIKEVSR
jgi:drug/metabolite transporter (DMT)-like permease